MTGDSVVHVDVPADRVQRPPAEVRYACAAPQHVGVEAIRTGAEYDILYRIIRPDEEVRWLHVRGRAALAADDGGVRLMAGVSLDEDGEVTATEPTTDDDASKS